MGRNSKRRTLLRRGLPVHLDRAGKRAGSKPRDVPAKPVQFYQLPKAEPHPLFDALVEYQRRRLLRAEEELLLLPLDFPVWKSDSRPWWAESLPEKSPPLFNLRYEIVAPTRLDLIAQLDRLCATVEHVAGEPVPIVMLHQLDMRFLRKNLRVFTTTDPRDPREWYDGLPWRLRIAEQGRPIPRSPYEQNREEPYHELTLPPEAPAYIHYVRGQQAEAGDEPEEAYFRGHDDEAVRYVVSVSAVRRFVVHKHIARRNPDGTIRREFEEVTIESSEHEDDPNG